MPGRECTGDSGRRWGQRGSHHEGSSSYPERQGIFRSDLEVKGALWLLCGGGKQGRSWEACAIMHQITH